MKKYYITDIDGLKEIVEFMKECMDNTNDLSREELIKKAKDVLWECQKSGDFFNS